MRRTITDEGTVPARDRGNNINASRKQADSPKYIINKWVLVKDRHLEFLKTDTIMYVMAEENYSRIYTDDGKKYLTSKLLKEWEGILPNDRFIRIHRSTLINLEFVNRIERWFNNTYKVYMKNAADPLTISRRYARKVRSFFQ